MKVVESFSQVTPLTIPMAGTSIDMEITTIYKLISLTNEMANFDLIKNRLQKSTSIKKNLMLMLMEVVMGNYYMILKIKLVQNLV